MIDVEIDVKFERKAIRPHYDSLYCKIGDKVGGGWSLLLKIPKDI